VTKEAIFISAPQLQRRGVHLENLLDANAHNTHLMATIGDAGRDAVNPVEGIEKAHGRSPCEDREV